MIENHLEFAKNLIGKTILLNFVENHRIYNESFYRIEDYDVTKSINKELSILENPATISHRVNNYPLYNVLISLAFNVRKDKRISIKVKTNSEEKEFLINENNYIILEKDESNFYILTPNNISYIYDEFYSNNSENRITSDGYIMESGDPDRAYEYSLHKNTGIIENYTKYSRTSSSIDRTSREYVLVIGQILSEKMANFLDQKGGFMKGYFIHEDELIIYQ